IHLAGTAMLEQADHRASPWATMRRPGRQRPSQPAGDGRRLNRPLRRQKMRQTQPTQPSGGPVQECPAIEAKRVHPYFDRLPQKEPGKSTFSRTGTRRFIFVSSPLVPAIVGELAPAFWARRRHDGTLLTDYASQ